MDIRRYFLNNDTHLSFLNEEPTKMLMLQKLHLHNVCISFLAWPDIQQLFGRSLGTSRGTWIIHFLQLGTQTAEFWQRETKILLADCGTLETCPSLYLYSKEEWVQSEPYGSHQTAGSWLWLSRQTLFTSLTQNVITSRDRRLIFLVRLQEFHLVQTLKLFSSGLQIERTAAC